MQKRAGKPTCENFCYPSQKLWQGKISNFAELPRTRRQSEAHNFETAQHIDKQKPETCDKCARNGTKPRGV